MTSKRVTVRLCDLCNDGETPGDHYSLTFPDGQRSSPDLCTVHAAPLEELRKVAPKSRYRAVVPVEAVVAARKTPRSKRGVSRSKRS